MLGDKLENIVHRYEEIMGLLNEPEVANDSKRFQSLMREQGELGPIVETYQAYKGRKQDVADSLQMLEEESDEDMREMLKEELAGAKKDVEDYEEKLKILLLPKDPNDSKNVIVEIRAGAGGDEAALFAAEIYRMYVHYAESRHWKVETMEAEEIGSSHSSTIGTGEAASFCSSTPSALLTMYSVSGVWTHPKRSSVSSRKIRIRFIAFHLFSKAS